MTAAQDKTGGNDASQNTNPAGSAQGGQAAPPASPPGKAAEEPPVATEQPGNDGGDGGRAYRPAGLPDHMVGTTDQETIDKLAKVVEGYRKTQADKGVPESADGYVFDFPEDQASKIFHLDENGKDPVLEAFKPLFHELGIPNAAAQAMVAKLAEVVGGISAEGADQIGGDGEVDFAYTQFGGPQKARATIDGVTAWAQALKADGKLDDTDLDEIDVIASHSRGLSVLAKLRQAAGQEPIPNSFNDGNAAADGLTIEQLNEMVADPRYYDQRKRDPEFVKKVTEGFRKVYANGDV